MALIYNVQIYSSAGVLQSYITDYESLGISRQCSSVDGLKFTLPSSSPSAQYITYGAYVIVYRKNDALGIAESIEFSGIIRSIVQVVSSIRSLQVTAVGMMALLGDRIIAWTSKLANRSLFTASPAETIIKTLFNYNIGSLATTAQGRILSGVITGMSTSASSGAGTALTLDCSMKPLFTTMQETAITGGGDIDLLYTAPASWSLVWYTGQRGTDRTATVILSVPTGTIQELIISTERVQDFNTVVIGGAGVNKARIYATRPASLPTGLNSREIYSDAKSTGNVSTASMQQQGTVLIQKQNRRRVTYRAKLLQNGALRYGRDYFLGDLVTIRDNNTNVTQKVQGVTLAFTSRGEESIDVILSAV